MVVGALDGVEARRAPARARCCSGRSPPGAGPGGVPVADRRGAFAFPLAGSLPRRLGDRLAARAEPHVQLRRRAAAALRAAHAARRPAPLPGGAALYVEVYCPEVPVYGPAFIAIGLCNDGPHAAGQRHVRDRPLPRSRARRTGARRGVSVAERRAAAADGQPRRARRVARLRSAPGARFPAGRHSLAILLTDADTGAPVSLDYRRRCPRASDARGNLTRVRLRLPAGTTLPAERAGLRDRRRVPAPGAPSVSDRPRTPLHWPPSRFTTADRPKRTSAEQPGQRAEGGRAGLPPEPRRTRGQAAAAARRPALRHDPDAQPHSDPGRARHRLPLPRDLDRAGPQDDDPGAGHDRARVRHRRRTTRRSPAS